MAKSERKLKDQLGEKSLADLQLALMSLKFKHKLQQLSDTSKIKKARRLIARKMTLDRREKV